MGWLWSDSSSAPAAASNSNILQENPSSSTSSELSPKPLSRDELAERELQSFLQELEADIRPSSTKYNRLPKQPPPSDHNHTSTASSFSPRNDASEPDPTSLSEALLPKSMSCRDAFDRAFYCQSLGGQFNNLYRYGTVRSCSENWGDFWFCMRVRGRGDGEREKLIREHYRERERRRYGRGEGAVRVEDGKPVIGNGGEEELVGIPRSSEDVWKSREKKVEWGVAFSTPIPVWEGSDEEWQRMERERRTGKVNGTAS